MILNRTLIQQRDKLRDSVVLDVPEMGPDAQVRLRPVPASISIGAIKEDNRARQMALFAAGSMVDDEGNRLYSASPADLDEILDAFPLGVLTAITTRATEISNPTLKADEETEKNSPTSPN